MTTVRSVPTGRPAPQEHAPYYGKYIALVPEDDALAALEHQWIEAAAFLRTIPEAKGDHRYAPEKWSIKEVLGHLADGERIFSYRALRFARKDQTPLPGFEENDYVPAGSFGRITVADLIGNWEAVRRATLTFYRGLEPEAWTRIGTANQQAISVRALAFVIAGHGAHHLEILKTRYL